MSDYETQFSPNDFEAVASDDAVKTDLELTCLLCAEVVCDIEHGDRLSILLSVAEDHWNERHNSQRLGTKEES